MGTTSEKLTYLNETKSKIKDNINLTGVNITNEDTFRSYAGKLKQGLLDILNNGNDYLYNNFPQLNDEGQNMSLTPTLEAPIKSELLGNTSQNGTPTPDAPVEVINATGRQEVKVIGKNLFDYDNSTVTGYYGQHPTKTNDGILGGWACYVTFPTPLPAGTYTISFKVKDVDNSATANLQLQDINNQNIPNSAVNIHTSNSKSITSTENIKRIRIDNAKNAVTTLIYDIQIEKGSTATEYEAYKEQSYEINLGKNLFNKDNANLINGYVSVDDTSIRPATYSRILYIHCEKNTTYTIQKMVPTDASLFFIFTSKDTPAVNGTIENVVNAGNITTHYSYTTNANANYLCVYFIQTNTTSTTLEEMLASIQIEKGSQPTSYAPYFTPIELCKIGDYKDSIRKGTGKNLLDKSNNLFQGTFETTTGGEDKISYVTERVCTKKINIDNLNGNLTYSGQYFDLMAFYDKNDSLISYSTNSSATIPNNSKSVRLRFFNNWSTLTVETLQNLNIMLENNTTATDYEPYGYKGKWLLTKKIGKVVLDGSENFTSAGTSGTDWRYNKTMSALGYASATTNTALCNSNYFVNTAKDTSRTWGAFYVNGNWLVFYDKNQNFTNATAFNNWLSTHNTIIYYVLETPTVEEITDSTLLNDLNNLEDAKSYNGTTNITITGETPADLKITALKNE